MNKNEDLKGRKILANNIVYYRLKNNWTQEDLAEYLNSNPRYISEIEHAKRDSRIDFITTIANTFKVELNDLFIKRELIKNHRAKTRKKKIK